MIFGLPVLALQWLGPALSARADEAVRWVPLLQAILTGWICYVGALPMLMEGLLLIREKLRADLVVATIGLLAYLYSVIALLGVFFRGRPFYRPFVFHCVVILLATWSGLRWWQLHRKTS